MRGYRFAFNAQEKDNEMYGDGGEYAFKYRVYSSRLGRFISVDPLAKKYPYLSTYQFAGNTPIWAKELEGLEPWYSNNGTSQNMLAQTNMPLSTMNADVVAHGPFSPEYAASMGLSMTPSAALTGVVVKSGGGVYQEPTQPTNTAYSPFIPTSKDVVNAAEAAGVGGTGLTIIGVALTIAGAPEAGIPIIMAGQTVSKTADAVKLSGQLSGGDVKGAAITGGFMLIGAGVGKVADQAPLEGASKEIFKASADLKTELLKTTTEKAVEKVEGTP